MFSNFMRKTLVLVKKKLQGLYLRVVKEVFINTAHKQKKIHLKENQHNELLDY